MKMLRNRKSKRSLMLSAWSKLTRKRILFVILIPVCLIYYVSIPDDTIPVVITSSVNQPKEASLRLDQFIGSPDSTLIEFGNGCKCDLISVDCLDAIRCLPDEKTTLQQIQAGIVKRQEMRSAATKWTDPLPSLYRTSPLGKATQSTTVLAWRDWLSKNTLPVGYDHKLPENYCNEKLYPYCVQHNLTGRSCYIEDFSKEDYYAAAMEKAALRVGKQSRSATAKELTRMRENPFGMTPYEYLLGFSSISRIVFSLRPHMLDIYEKQLKTIHPTKNNNPRGVPPLRVALHVRRGDACDHKLNGYSRVPSSLDSEPQFSGNRLCYETAVYLETLVRIQSIVGTRRLEVYIATDHMLSLLDEIEKTNLHLFHNVTWKYVDYSRQLFNYSNGLRAGTAYIENSNNQEALGETAALDIWHLSHAQVFVGHMGSRFGKLSWWQAVGRHHGFVPFFTVDGHSVCCDIDEACGRMAPTIISMENCLTFSREYASIHVDPAKYWVEGSTVRGVAAVNEVKFWRRKFPGRAIPKGLYMMMNRSLELFMD